MVSEDGYAGRGFYYWPHWDFTTEFIQEVDRRVQASNRLARGTANSNIPEPELIIMATCDMLEITNPFSG
jgi:hypothetical protein